MNFMILGGGGINVCLIRALTCAPIEIWGDGPELERECEGVEAVTGLEADIRYTEWKAFNVSKKVLNVRNAFREQRMKPETPIDRGIRNLFD